MEFKSEFKSVKDAAKMLGIPLRNFYRFIKNGKIQVEQHPLKKTMFVSEREVRRVSEILKKFK